MDDEELTRYFILNRFYTFVPYQRHYDFRLAVEELLRDAKKFMAQRNAEFKATQLKTPMKANKVFLSNTIRNVISFNKNKKGGNARKDDKSKNNSTTKYN